MYNDVNASTIPQQIINKKLQRGDDEGNVLTNSNYTVSLKLHVDASSTTSLSLHPTAM